MKTPQKGDGTCARCGGHLCRECNDASQQPNHQPEQDCHQAIDSEGDTVPVQLTQKVTQYQYNWLRRWHSTSTIDFLVFIGNKYHFDLENCLHSIGGLHYKIKHNDDLRAPL